MIRCLLAKAVKDGLLGRNVASNVEIPRTPVCEVPTLTPDRARHPFDCAQGQRFEEIYLLALTLGMRKGEIPGLRCADLDLESGTLRCRCRVWLIRYRLCHRR